MTPPQDTATVETVHREESAASLLAQLAEGASTIVRKESELLRAEIDQKARQAAGALGMIAGGALMALVALHVLAAALVAALAELGVEPGWAALIVGGGVAIVAFALFMGGTRTLKASSLSPKRMMRSAGRDAAFAKEATR